jgi:hypothetical protein
MFACLHATPRQIVEGGARVAAVRPALPLGTQHDSREARRMTTFINTQRAVYTMDTATEVPGNSVDHHLALRQCLGARKNTGIFLDAIADQHKQLFRTFVNEITPRLYATPCELPPGAVNELVAACTAYHAQSNALRHTVAVLGAAEKLLNEDIAAHVGVCGSAAMCIIDEHVAELRTELAQSQSKRDDTQNQVDMLLTLRSTTVAQSEANGRQWSTAPFGTNFTPPQTLSRSDRDALLDTDTITEEYRDIRVTKKGSSGAPEIETVTQKVRKR